MIPNLKKYIPVDIRSLGLDEKWLQDRIKEDSSLLGLGELEIAGREHRQPAGGRIDFLMRDTEDETYYEVEIMLGALDETHIIRAIEYWDIERQRRPQFEHRAVIVAEKITARFFNVLRLMNRSVPIIAIKLSAFRNGDDIVLHPITVLDVFEEVVEVEDGATDQVDRAYWEKKADLASLAIMDKILSLLKAKGIQPRVTYNRHHIALGTTGRNFCWFHPRKAPGHCHIEFRVTGESRDSVLSALQAGGIDANPTRAENATLSITPKFLDEQYDLVMDALKRAEEASRL